jgi:hypothetical protein
MNTDLRSLVRVGLGAIVAFAVVWGFIQGWNPPDRILPKPMETRAALSAVLVFVPVVAPTLSRALAP